LCFGLQQLHGPVKGQIAHVDRDRSNNASDNLVWLCLTPHDDYDARPSQSKGLTPAEVKYYRQELYDFIGMQQRRLEPDRISISLSSEAGALAEYLNTNSRTGDLFDPQVRIDALETELELPIDDLELAIDELAASGLIEINGSRDVIYPTSRLFWETDPIFAKNDPVSDAEAIARVLVAHPGDAISMTELALTLEWQKRRLNPAASYLVEMGKARARPAVDAVYCYGEIVRTTATKRFVHDLGSNE
jgi:hypothetical protein